MTGTALFQPLVAVDHDGRIDIDWGDSFVGLVDAGGEVIFGGDGGDEQWAADLLDGILGGQEITAADKLRRLADHIEQSATKTVPMIDGEPCTDCDGVGWLIMASNGDESRDWIERHDDCAFFTDDLAAAAAASTATRRPLGYAVPWGTRFWQPFLRVGNEGQWTDLDDAWWDHEPTDEEWNAHRRLLDLTEEIRR